MIDSVRTMCCNIDICRIEFLQSVDGTVYLLNALALDWRQNLKTECSVMLTLQELRNAHFSF